MEEKGFYRVNQTNFEAMLIINILEKMQIKISKI